MKKAIVLLLAVLMMVMPLAGCGKTEAPAPAAEAPAAEAPAAEAPAAEEAAPAEEEALPLAGKKIGFAHLTLMDEWCVSVADAVESMGKELGAAEVNVQVAEFDLETQVQQIENFINQKYDVIFVLTGFTDGILPYIQEAVDAGIPVVAMDGTIEGKPLVSHIVWDQAYTGTLLGQNCAEYVKANLGGKCRVVCLDSKSLEYMASRQIAFLAELRAQLGDENVVVVNDADCQTREEAMNTIISINDEYDIVYAASDSNGHGAVAGLESKGLTGIPVFACGGYGEELYNAISDENSAFYAVINVPGANIVKSAYEMLLKYLNGDDDIPERVNCDVLYVSKDSTAEDIATLKP